MSVETRRKYLTDVFSYRSALFALPFYGVALVPGFITENYLGPEVWKHYIPILMFFGIMENYARGVRDAGQR